MVNFTKKIFSKKRHGLDWILGQIKEITEHIDYVSPVDFVEKHRYLSSALTSKPGPMRYDVNPYMREILDCFSMNSPVREVNVLKGVQMTYTVSILESVVFYFMCYLKIYPTMMVTADAELVKMRIENNILPMLQLSGFSDIIQTADEKSKNKSGKTKDLIQWKGGGSMIPIGAQNPNKMRASSVLLLLKDEIDGWPLKVGNDGDPDALTDARTSGYTNERKILRGSTPLEMSTSKIFKNYLLGDQRHYYVTCKYCGYEQYLEWKGENDDGKRYGITFDFENNILVPESVRYLCKNCQGEYFNHDKTYLFDPDNGAHWEPTATPSNPLIRSYYLPAYYSPPGFYSWNDCVRQFLRGFDPVKNKTIDINEHQTFVNNVKGWPFENYGHKLKFENVSAHRRLSYQLGEVPNNYAKKYSGSEILFLICTVDVHDKNLAVKVTGVCTDCRTYLIDYWRIEDDDCTDISSPCWIWLETLIEDQIYTADNGRKYKIMSTFIDAGHATDTVKQFCDQYMYSKVYPIFGREKVSKESKMDQISVFKNKTSGKLGFNIKVDYYKDRLSHSLKRNWEEEQGLQSKYHFNAPVDTTDEQLKELTCEIKRKKIGGKADGTFEWHRPGNKANELWDLTVYAHAGIEIIAYIECLQEYKLDYVDWGRFWAHMEHRLETKVVEE